MKTYEEFLQFDEAIGSNPVARNIERRSRSEMQGRGADRKADAANNASKNQNNLQKWGKGIWHAVTHANPGGVVKDTFNQSAAAGTLDAAKAQGLYKG